MPDKLEVAAQAVEVAVKVAPPVAVSGLTIAGYELPEVISVLTIIYLVVQIGYIAQKWARGK